MRRLPWALVVVVGTLTGIGAFALIRPDVSAADVIAVAQVPATSIPRPPPTTTSTPPSVTTTAPATTTTERVPDRPLVIQAVGDVNFDPSYISAFGVDGYEIAFAGLDDVFLEDDLTIINLECPVTDGGPRADKQFSFQCDPAALPVAEERGVDVANLANNHGQDRGVEGLLDSIANVNGAGIVPVGVGENIVEAMAPALFDIDGWTVAVVGMGGVVPGDAWLAGADTPGMASGDDTDQMARSVRRAAEMADVVVVTIHWGTELVTEPSAEDRERASAMIGAGADMIFGHHPHRLGAMEVIDGVPVYWTLGNFIWPRLSVEGARSAIARVVFSPDGSGQACTLPVDIVGSGRPTIVGELECEVLE